MGEEYAPSQTTGTNTDRDTTGTRAREYVEAIVKGDPRVVDAEKAADAAIDYGTNVRDRRAMLSDLADATRDELHELNQRRRDSEDPEQVGELTKRIELARDYVEIAQTAYEKYRDSVRHDPSENVERRLYDFNDTATEARRSYNNLMQLNPGYLMGLNPQEFMDLSDKLAEIDMSIEVNGQAMDRFDWIKRTLEQYISDRKQDITAKSIAAFCDFELADEDSIVQLNKEQFDLYKQTKDKIIEDGFDSSPHDTLNKFVELVRVMQEMLKVGQTTNIADRESFVNGIKTMTSEQPTSGEQQN